MARSFLRLRILVLVTAPIFIPVAGAAAPERIPGFTQASSGRQESLEERFKQIPSAAEERRQHRVFTSEPHPAGSPRNNELARYIAREWK